MSTFDDIRNQADTPEGQPFDASPTPDATARLRSDSDLQRRTAAGSDGTVTSTPGSSASTITDAGTTTVRTADTSQANLPDVSISQYNRPYSMPDAAIPGSDNSGFAALPVDQQRPPRSQDVYENSNHFNSKNFDNPISHLEQAKMLMRQGGLRAAEPEYFAAVRAADSIDQNEVARERAHVKEELKHEKDPAKRRALVQEECTLHDMQRMPGAARANLAFAYLVTGHQPEGQRLMMTAAQLDPEMVKDPNFIRHMRSVEALYQQQQQMPPQGERTIPGQGRVPGAPGAPGVPADGTVRQRGASPDGTANGDGTISRGPARSTTGSDTIPMPSGTNYVGSKGFADPIDDLSKASDAFKQAGKMTPQVKALFEKAIQDADNIDRSTDPNDKKSIAYLEKQALAQMGAVKPEDVPDKLKALAAEQSDMVKKLPKDKQDQLTALVKQMAAVDNEADYNKLMGQMTQVAPDVAAKQKQIDQLNDGISQYRDIEALKNSSVLTRFTYEEALRKAGDNDSAKQVLTQVLKLDKTLATDDDVQAAAKALGMKLDAAPTPTATGDGTDHTTQAKPSDTSNNPSDFDKLKNKAGVDALDLLQKAEDSLAKNGFNDETKKDYQDAIKSADALKGNPEAQAVIDKHIAALTSAQKAAHDAGDTDSEQKASDAIDVWNAFKNMPDQVRLEYAKAQYKAGDQAGAKATMSEAVAKDPDLAKDPIFQTYISVMQSGKELSSDNLKAALNTVADASNNAGDPVQALVDHEQKAQDLAKQNKFASADTEWKAAVKAADDLKPVVTADIAQLQKQADAETDPGKKQVLVGQIQKEKGLLQLQVSVRGDAALFYIQNNKGDEAHALLQQIATINPAIVHGGAVTQVSRLDTHTGKPVSMDISYKDLMDSADYADKSTLGKLVDHAKGTFQNILIDGGSGTVGMATTNILSSVFPEGKAFKLLAIAGGVAAGGGTHAGLSKVMGRDVGWDDVAWGGVDTLAFLSGNEVRKGLTSIADKSLTTEKLADIAMGRDALIAEKNALTSKGLLTKVLGGEAVSTGDSALLKSTLTKTWSADEKNALEAAMKGTASDAQKSVLSGKLESAESLIKATGEKRSAFVTQLGDAKGLSGASKATRILEKELSDKRAAVLKETLDTRFAETKANYAAKWGDKPILNWREPWQSTKRLFDSGSIQRTGYELQAKVPVAWRFGETLSPFREAQNEYLTARSGSVMRWLSPIGGDRVVGHLNFGLGKLEDSGSVRSLEGRLFWRRFGVDAATAGATGGVLEGTHNFVDWKTGKKTAGEATRDFAWGTAKDAAIGGGILSMFHGLGDTSAKVAGAGEPLTIPKPLSQGSSMWSNAAQPFRWAGYYGKSFFKAPEAYEPATLPGKATSYAASGFRGVVINPIVNSAKWVSSSDAAAAQGLRSSGKGLLGYVPQISEGITSHQEWENDQDLLSNLEKQGPLTDKPQDDVDDTTSVNDSTTVTPVKANATPTPAPTPKSTDTGKTTPSGKDAEDELPQ